MKSRKFYKHSIFYAFLVYSSEASCRLSLEQTLNLSFPSARRGGCYSHNHCQMSVYYFVKRYHKLEFLQNAQVLLLRHAQPNGLIWHYADSTRNNYGVPWSYHFIILIEGKIYDFSYGETPSLSEPQAYFNSLYVAPDQIDITPMNFQEYIKFIESKLNMDQALEATPQRMSFDDFMSSLNP